MHHKKIKTKLRNIMKFTISSGALCSRLQTLNRVLNSKNSLQILSCILFDLKKDKLILTASDGDVYLRTELPVNDCEDTGKFALNAQQIINGLKEISEQPVEIVVNDSTYNVEIKYQNGRGEFVGQNGKEYPAPQAMEKEGTSSLSVSSEILVNGLTHTLFATADDELRPVMNGVYFDLQPVGLTFVASDGHKLVRDRNVSVTTDVPTAFILPKKPAKILKEVLSKEMDDVTIKFNDTQAQVKVDSYELSCRLIEGRYPNYNSVIPTDNPYKITIDRQALLGALRRVIVFASTTTSLIKIEAKQGQLVISSQDVDFSTSAKESIPCDYDGTDIRIGFKGQFLIEMLSSISSDEIILELADPSRAGVITPAEQNENEDMLTLLMPMMLND